MSVVQRTIQRPIDVIWEALATPETYPHWLVGCQAIRSVDDGWPAPSRRFHHRVGLAGPLTVADHTEVLEVDAPNLLSLEVRARPFGRGRATFTLSPASGADGLGATIVQLDEVPIGLLAPTKPLADPVTARRNRRSLAQLAEHLGAQHPA